ncbi:MAG: DNA polymerase III subunit delta [bacterium]|jgi:DNA polymerase-3 subunit delta
MNWRQLWQQLEQKQVAACYFLWGEENHLIDLTVTKIEQALDLGQLRELNYERLDARTIRVSELAAACRTLPWLAPRRLVVYGGLSLGTKAKTTGQGNEVEQEEKVATGESSSEQEFLEVIAALPPTTCLVITAPGPCDSRRRIFKAVAKLGIVQEFPRLRGRELEDWIRTRGVELGLEWGRGAVEFLAARTGPGLEQLEQELAKLAAYAGPGGSVGREEIELLVPETSEKRAFDLIDAALTGQRDRALLLLEQLLRQGESPIGLVALLARQVRLIAAAKEELEKGGRPEKLASTLKLHPFVAKKVTAQSRRFSWEAIYSLVTALAAADESLKTSTLSPCLALEQIILDLKE